MEMATVYVIIYGLAAGAANLFGGLLVSSRRVGQTTLGYLLALGAGFMLAAVFLKIVPESIEMWEGHSLWPMVWVLIGYLLLQLVEHTIAPHFHFGEETHEEAMLAQHAAVAGVGAMAVHTFFDGVWIAAASLVSMRLGVLVFIAVLLHKIPEGFTVASMMLAAGRSRRGARMASAFVGLATLLGAVLVIIIQNVDINSRPISAFILPLSAGVTLYVAASDLIPEVNHRGRGVRTSLMVFAGVALMYVAELMLEALGLAH